LHRAAPPPDLPSFPTRRSSDLSGHVREPGAPCETRARADRIGSRGIVRVVIAHGYPSWAALYTTPFFMTRLTRSRAAMSFSGSPDRKSTRLNSSHDQISYAVFC